LVKQGCPTRAVFPYDENDFLKQPTSEQSDLAKAFKLKSFANFFQEAGNCTDNTINDMKQWLASGDAIVFSLKSFNKFKNAFNDPGYVVPPPDPSEKPCRSHAILAVGYNDNLYYTDKNGVKHYGAFKFVNSKGPDYGYRGFVYVSYDYIKTAANEAWCMTDATDPKGFTIGLTPVKQRVMVGNSIVSSITLSSLGGFKNEVSISVSGLPDGISSVLEKNSLFLDSEKIIELKITLDEKLVLGQYNFVVSAKSGNIVHKVGGIIDVKPRSGLLIHIRNRDGEPANKVLLVTESLLEYDTMVDGSGSFYVPDSSGQCNLVASSMIDHIGIMKNISAPGEYTLDAKDLCPVNLSTRKKDSSLMPAYFRFVPSPDLIMEFPPYSDTIFLSPGTYTITAIGTSDFYYLGKTDVKINASEQPIRIDLDASSMETGTFTISYDKLDSVYISFVSFFGDAANFFDHIGGPIMSISSGTKFTFSAGKYQIMYRFGIYVPKIPETWRFSFYPKTICISNKDDINLNLGDQLNGIIKTDKQYYSPGENVNIEAFFEDSTGWQFNNIDYYYKPGYYIGSYYELIKGNMTIKDPDSNVVLSGTGDEYWSRPFCPPYNFKIPSDSKEGNYEIIISLDTGPFQGVVSASYSFRVGKDTIKPDLILTSPGDGSTVDQDSITVSGTATDSESGIDKVTINDSEASLSSDGSFSKTVALTEGTNTITIIATDKVGNKTTKTITVTYRKPDRVVPDLIIKTPNNFSTVDQNFVTIIGTAIDESGIDKVTVNGSEVPLSDASFSKTVYLVEGTNTITIIATDKAENESTKTIIVTYQKAVQKTVITLQPDNSGDRSRKGYKACNHPCMVKNGCSH